MSKPVILQSNDAGGWKTVVRFDAADDAATAEVVAAAEMLQSVSRRTRFRIVMDDGLQTNLTHLSAGVWTDYKGRGLGA